MERFLTTKFVTTSSNSTTVKRLRPASRTRLTISLPKYTVIGSAINRSVITVPRSSSETNARDKPDIDEKNMTTQRIPESISGETDSLPIANKIMETAVTTNITSALIAYRVRNSDRRSLRKRLYARAITWCPDLRFVRTKQPLAAHSFQERGCRIVSDLPLSSVRSLFLLHRNLPWVHQEITPKASEEARMHISIAASSPKSMPA